MLSNESFSTINNTETKSEGELKTLHRIRILVLIGCFLQCCTSGYCMIVGIVCSVEEESRIEVCTEIVIPIQFTTAMIYLVYFVDVMMSAVFVYVVMRYKRVLGCSSIKDHLLSSIWDSRVRMYQIIMWASFILFLSQSALLTDVKNENWLLFVITQMGIPLNNIRTSMMSPINMQLYPQSSFEGATLDQNTHDDHLENDSSEMIFWGNPLSISENYEKRKELCKILNWVCVTAMIYNGCVLVYDISVAVLHLSSAVKDIQVHRIMLMLTIVTVYYRQLHANFYFTKLHCPNSSVLVSRYKPDLDIPWNVKLFNAEKNYQTYN